MNNLEKTLRFNTRTDLVVQVESENLGIAVIGGEEEETELSIKVDFVSNAPEEITLESILETTFDEEKNTLHIALHDMEKTNEAVWKCRLKVPYVTEVRGSTENGSISLKNLHGIQELRSENGPLKVEAIEGTLDIKAENGPVKVLDCTGTIIVKTENGPMKMKHTHGDIQLTTENGPVKLVGCEGNLNLKHENGVVRSLQSAFKNVSIVGENGGIYYEFSPILAGTIQLENDNGKITLVIPDELEFDLSATNLHGKIHIGIPDDYDQHTKDEAKIVEIVRGAAKVDITVNNQSGSIVITNKKSAINQAIILPDISEVFSSVLQEIPDEKTRDMVEVKLKKAQEKLKAAQNRFSKIQLSDVETVVNDALEGIKTEVTTILHDVSSDTFKKKAETTINSNISKVVDAVQHVVKDRDVSPATRQKVDERSRLKILELLEAGKISADDAERLLKAMGKTDE